MRTLASLVTAAVVSAPALAGAHPGHGASAGTAPWHWIADHGLGALVAVGVATAAGLVWRRARR